MAGRVTTISRQVGGQNVTQPASAGASSPKRPTFLTQHIDDPKQLTQLLNQQVKWVEQITAPARSSPITSGVILQGVALAGGVTTQMPHMLGREPIGWICIRAQTAAWSGYEGALSAGLDRTKYLAMVSANTGTYDFLVF